MGYWVSSDDVDKWDMWPEIGRKCIAPIVNGTVLDFMDTEIGDAHKSLFIFRYIFKSAL